MKKLLFLSLILFSSCKCLISQVPPQYVYIGENCSAILPDYTTKVHATDNCVLASLVQTPAPGTILTLMINDVVIKATDNSGNSSQISFGVILIDTIPPIITVDDTTLTGDNTLTGSGYDVLEALYNQADRIIADKLKVFNENFPYAELGLPVSDSTYYKEYLITIASPGYAVTGQGDRIWQFWNPNDTIQ